jgi:putative spermidine/putrescine transport system ATP-binding protein
MARERPAAAAAPAPVTMSGLSKAFDGTTAVDDVTLCLAPGSFTALLGPSGCGKSTLLALVAGLLEPDRGTVTVDDRDLTGVLAERRPVGLVFQKPLLLPHLNVEDNVAFGLRMGGMPRGQRRSAVREMLDAVGLGALGRRRVGELSGGQEQRIALARALVLAPRLLLLDEPFSQLDAQLRAEMRALIRALTEHAKTTTLFVTHDQGEAVEIADDIALMLDGRIAGHSVPEVFYRDPPSLAAARFFGVTNEIPGAVRAGRFTPAGGHGEVATDACDGPAVAVARPETLRLDTAGAAAVGAADDGGLRLSGVVREARFAGTHLAVTVATADSRQLRVHLPVGTPVDLGASAAVTAPADAVRVFSAGAGP